MQKFLILIFIILLNINNIGQTHKLFTEVLNNYVKNGLVDYKKIKHDNNFYNYLNQLTITDPSKLNREEKLAFWINAYNAFTLQVVAENYPIGSITELHTGGKIIGFLLGKTVWDKEFITINNKKYSLNHIEHEILRKMNEPRIHFAIVCAAISCPILRSEAYEANKIYNQLNEDGIKFLRDNNRNSFNIKDKRAEISKIFDWFSEDFGDSDKNILNYIKEFLKEEIKNDISTNVSKWKISYKSYNWDLNEIK